MKRIVFGAFALLFAVAAIAAPIQYNPNAALATAIDATTGNAVVPYADHNGALYSNTGSTVATYHAVIADATPAATATDVMTLCGSATKTIKLTRVQATADATAAGVIDFYTFIRTAANTGGTSAAVTPASHDSNNAAATAVVLKYTANPSALGAGNMFAADHYALPAAASTGYPGTPWLEDMGIRNTQPVVLRGTANCFAFNLNGQTIPAGMNLYVTIEWTEE